MKKDKEEMPEYIKYYTKHLDDKLLLVLSSLDDVQTKMSSAPLVSNPELKTGEEGSIPPGEVPEISLMQPA